MGSESSTRPAILENSLHLRRISFLTPPAERRWAIEQGLSWSMSAPGPQSPHGSPGYSERLSMASRAILHPDRDTDATRSVRILFAYPEEATFVRTDREILARFADVTSLCAPPGTRFETLAKALHGHDLAFIWFGLGHASRLVLAAKLLRKSTILVGGGWDVADMPEIGYGAARGTYGRVRAALTFALANRVLAFSRWSAEQVRAVSPRSRVEPLYLCVDTETW